MRKFAFAFAVFMVTVFAADSRAFALLKAEGRYWFSDLNDTVKVTNNNVAGTEINLRDDLGIDTKKNFWEGRITLEGGKHKLRYGFMPLKWDGSRNLTQQIVFNGRTYSASTRVDSEFKVDYHRLGYEYDVIDVAKNRLGVIFEVKYFEADARIKAPAPGIDEAHKASLPIPTVGLAAEVGLPFLFSVGGEVTGVGIGKQAYLVDAEAGVNLKPAPFVTLSGGYRVFKMHVEKNDDKADLTLKGPFVTLRAGF